MSTEPIPTWRTHYALGLLSIIYIFNIVDRQIMSILIEPIKQEFGISDTGMGLLSGLSFAVLYGIFGFPLGRLADRIGGKPVVAVCCVLWSLMTMVCGLSTGFMMLLIARMGVAIGEAGGTAPAVSLVSSLYPAKNRSVAIAILMMGSSAGAILGVGLGGWIALHYGWRVTFLVIGAPGVILGLILMATVPSPPRPAAVSVKVQDPWLETLQKLCRMPSFILLLVVGSLAGIAGYAIGMWTPSFLMRVHGLDIRETGILLGLAGGTLSTCGTLVCGWLTDRMVKNHGSAWQLAVPAIATLMSVPFGLAFYLWPAGVSYSVLGVTVPQGFLFFLGFACFATWWAGPCISAITHLFSTHLRGQATSLFVMAMTILGIGLGPLYVGALNDILTALGVQDALRYSLSAAMVLLALASVAMVFALPRYRRQLQAPQALRHDPYAPGLAAS